MGLFEITSYGMDDFFLFINDYVDDKCKLRFSGSPNHIPVYEVSLQYTRPRGRMGNEL